MKDHSTTQPIDESWVAHLRDLSTGVEPPTSANPHVMSRVAIRRTRTRRAVLTTGGGVLTVAAVAGAAFAIGSPTTAGTLLPGAATSASADPSTSAEERRARELQTAAPESRGSAHLADGWEVQEVAGLTYALPPEIVTSGEVQDEPGVTSEMWHSSEDPDAPPFLRIAYYDEGSATPAWPNVADRPGGEQFDLPGAKRAVALDVAAEAAGLPEGDLADGEKGPTMLVLEPASGPGAYVISLNLPQEGAEDFVRAFQSTLRLN